MSDGKKVNLVVFLFDSFLFGFLFHVFLFAFFVQTKYKSSALKFEILRSVTTQDNCFEIRDGVSFCTNLPK